MTIVFFSKNDWLSVKNLSITIDRNRKAYLFAESCGKKLLSFSRYLRIISTNKVRVDATSWTPKRIWFWKIAPAGRSRSRMVSYSKTSFYLDISVIDIRNRLKLVRLLIRHDMYFTRKTSEDDRYVCVVASKVLPATAILLRNRTNSI
jgi:hypothetical protein